MDETGSPMRKIVSDLTIPTRVELVPRCCPPRGDSGVDDDDLALSESTRNFRTYQVGLTAAEEPISLLRRRRRA